MGQQEIIRLAFIALLTAVGVLSLAYSVWARIGGSAAARHWMRRGPRRDIPQERMALLGIPALGIGSLALAASLLPSVGPYLLIVTAPLMLLMFALLIWARLSFTPFPDALYPGWARRIRQQNRRDEQAMEQYLRKR